MHAKIIIVTLCLLAILLLAIFHFPELLVLSAAILAACFCIIKTMPSKK